MDIAQALAQSILATRSDAIVATDRDGVITFWNPGAERIFQHAAAEAVGRSLDLIIPERLRARHWSGYRQFIATGRSRYGEGDLLAVPGVRKDGSRVSLEFTIVPLTDPDGRIAGVAALMRDVTARFEETRELRRKLAAVSGGGAAGQS
ncbi:MAG: PAS domain-containing protein [Hyphomicrobiales bacterium]|nr:PAS domain-containing protein [Hyphomicrobiales bacterium]MBV9429083.1 PAS domain-containing protein [Bradyrhizobiaceae bacterium]